MADVEPKDLSVDHAALEQYNHQGALAISSLDDIKRLSTIFIESGMFKSDNRLSQKQQLYQAGVKIIAGVEFGIQPFAAMRGINIINGNAEMSANLMAAKVKKHPKYDYRVDKWDSDECTITFYEIPHPGAKRTEWDKLGESSFNLEDAQTAQLAGGQNWKKFARNMYFARAMSNGVRIYTPDVFYGAPVYVEGEIGGEFDVQAKATTDEPAVADESDVKSEPVEGEIVAPVEAMTKSQIEEIKKLSKEAGAADTWFSNIIVNTDTFDEAEAVLAELRSKLSQAPEDRVWE